MNRRSTLVRLAAAATVGMLPTALRAQDLPAQIRLVLPFAAGGALDINTRFLADGMAASAGRVVIVDNKPGAGGTIGAAEVARARPDGSTLLVTTGGHTTSAALYTRLPYDPLRDFTPITRLSTSGGFLLLVAQDSKFRTPAQLVQAARAKPSAVSYASAGVGNTTHLVGALFARAIGAEMVHVPYRGSAQIVTDISSGQVDMTFLAASLAKPFMAAGKLRPLAVAGDARHHELPEVPSLGELGHRGVDVPAWSGVLGPAGMNEATVAAVYRTIKAAAASPAFAGNSGQLGLAVDPMPPADFAAYLASEVARYKAELAPLNIRLD